MCDLIKIMILQIRNEKLSSHSLRLGCPASDMSLGGSNMKLRIVGVFNTPQKGIDLWSITQQKIKF